MNYFSPAEKKHTRFVRVRTLLILLAGFVILTVLDFPLLHLFYRDTTRSVESHDWYRALRIVGYMGTWSFLGIAFLLYDRHRHRAGAVFLSAITSGLIAETLKLVIVRERPVDGLQIQPGWYHFRAPFSGFVDGSNLGLPSSHAAVAFGGCLMFGAIFPSIRRLMFLLALGCGFTRMLTGTHFATDIYAGALIGWLVSIGYTRITPGLEPKFKRRY